ncbi:hypothetical protein [Xanthobacter wiegelii]|uniref:hypothetical protein n=1 Tax=Xanthobacter wiegelii TaxID=3119913 RepID=UPI00372CACEB
MEVMQRHCSPDHPDCWVECPGNGAALYIDPPGFCLKDCGDESLAKLLFVASAIGDGPADIGRRIYLKGEISGTGIIQTPLYFDSYYPRRRFFQEFGSSDRMQSTIKNFDALDTFYFSFSGAIRDAWQGIADSIRPNAAGLL